MMTYAAVSDGSDVGSRPFPTVCTVGYKYAVGPADWLIPRFAAPKCYEMVRTVGDGEIFVATRGAYFAERVERVEK